MEVTQKTKIKWEIEGDENSKYFHGILNKKRSQLAIRGILVDVEAPRLQVNLEFPNKLNLDQQFNLELEVSRDEIKRAVWDCGTDRSPGPDGFTFGFYRRYSSFLEKDMEQAVRYFFHNGAFSKSDTHGADNHPPMLDKDMYDSWKSRMELYMQNRDHGRMILESVEHGPLIWPMVEENGLPTDIYSLVNHHRVVKDLWERVQLLMQGTSLTKQERECKLYNAFDKFTHIKGESLHTLPPEWSKFVTDVKLVKDLHTSNFDQLHAYLEQHELHANEVRIMRERNQDPLAFVANQQMTPPHFNTYQSYYNNPQLQQQFSPSQHGSIQPNQHYSSHYPSQT
ncbi:hypothetical protein Tco_0532281 [Tanacetum coccineum]